MTRSPRLLIIVLFCTVLGAWAASQSLANLAKKSKSSKPASAERTFTDSDLKGRSGSVSTSKVPEKVESAAKAKGDVATPKKAAPAPASSSGAASPPANQMTPVEMGKSVKEQAGDKGKR